MQLPISIRSFTFLLAFVLGMCSGNGWNLSGSGQSQRGRTFAAESEDDAKPTNRLSRESSPYLLLHAHNPVDWYPWGPEALAKAKKENKVIFLSIGYSSCYWCHVMERKVFSNPKIAAYMNENFVNIKVDREERPDIDELYMTALNIYQQASGAPPSGGWPLSMFLTPDTKPLLGGTYFPPEDMKGLIGFPSLAEKITEIWRDKRKQAESNAEFLTHHLQRSMKQRPALAIVPLDRKLVETVRQEIGEKYDPQYGGFGFDPANDKTPKFPTPTKLALLQYEAAQHDDQEAAKILQNTLDQMAAGGIWDHLGGGFHRYSTDRYWHVPHFEKMLYDNAQLADIYLEAFRQTGEPRYRRTAEEIFAFVNREMTSPEGGFYSALDAETDAVEGQSYLWTEQQIKESLSEKEADLFIRAYGVEGEPELEGEHVLREVKKVAELAKEFQLTPEEVTQRLAQARNKLLDVRAQRKSPLTDDKIMVDWNGLMISAYANGGALLNRPDYLQTAEKAAQFILDNMRDEQGGLLHTYRAGEAKFAAYVDDYAFLTQGLLALYQTTGKEKWLQEARQLTNDQLKMFWDEDRGGCFFTSHGHEKLLARSKQTYDSARPSGNSVTIRNLIRLAQFTDEASYREHAKQALSVFAPLIQAAPLGSTNMALAAAEFLDPPKLTINKPAETGQNTTPASQPTILLASALQEVKQKKKKPEIVTGKVFLSVDKLPAGKTCEVLVVVRILDHWHINANPAGDEFAIATELTSKSKLKTKLGKIRYPKGKKMMVTGSEEPLPVYTTQALIRTTLEVPVDAGGKKEELELNVRYQACDDKRCLRPMTLKLKVPIDVAAEGEPVKQINQKMFQPEKKKAKSEK